MADASCSGPSPFKRLVDHQSRDVSHQQDRLVDRSASHHHSAFRSARQQPHGPDNFNAFMDGAPSTAMPGMPCDPVNRLAAHAAALQQPGGLMNQQQQQQHHHHHHLELLQHARASPAPDTANWAADFARFSGAQQQMRSLSNMAAAVDSSSAMQMSQQQHFVQRNPHSAFGQAFISPMYGGAAAGFMDAPYAASEADFDKEMSRWMSAHGSENMTEVDAAMDQMARELQLNEAILPTDAETATAATTSTATATEILQNNAPSARYSDLESPEIGNLSLQDVPVDLLPLASAPEEQASLNDVDNVDDDDDAAAAARAKSAVSEAAERLLDSVQHESGEKWQNSVFLSLMRDFRDGRKDIIDNEIRDADAQNSQNSQNSQPPTT
ncbi:hypothetical protein E4U41_004733 [Claviceps citrina]|nr:hypothetical protein E4U41_004733 [Claviceps citrina]